MKRLLAAALLILGQDPSPVPALLSRINDRDPVAAFRAIGDLADLGPAHRAEAEKGADSLPAFYRDALLAELKCPGGSTRRVSLEGRKTLRDHLADWERGSDLKFDLKSWDEHRPGKDPLAREAIVVQVKE